MRTVNALLYVLAVACFGAAAALHPSRSTLAFRLVAVGLALATAVLMIAALRAAD